MGSIAKSLGFRCVLIGGVIVASVACVFIWRCGSLTLAVATLEGKRVVVSPVVVDLGKCVSGTRHIAKFTVTNLTSSSIRIVGTEEGCACLSLDELPTTLGPYERRDMSMRALVSGEEFLEPVILYLDINGELVLTALEIRAQVLPAESVNEGHTP